MILTLKHPSLGKVRYGFDRESEQWEKVEEQHQVQVPSSYFNSSMYVGIESVMAGGDNGIMAFTAEVGEPDAPNRRGGAQHAAVIIDLSNAEDMIVYSEPYKYCSGATINNDLS